jgi:S-adenosylmethionine:tRNA ribosyltransferase-isomerase
MQVSDLNYDYPPELVATEPARPTRVAFVAGGAPSELDMDGLLGRFAPGDLLVINESKVIPARVFSNEEVEILFLRPVSADEWQVLFPAREFKAGARLALPGGVAATLVQKGLPQILRVSPAIGPEYFFEHGEMALPPYIQEARGERHNRESDAEFYQSAWAKNPGSVAAPTASLHFTAAHLRKLKERGVQVAALTLHVGAGTFLPIKSEKLDDHTMHSEQVEIPRETLDLIKNTKGRVWALGTTVARALEAWAAGDFGETDAGAFGETKIFIKPGFEWKVVGGLLTNFHQPKSTLLSLVSAFAGLDNVKNVYAWAVDKRFRLFSYGDLSAWTK